MASAHAAPVHRPKSVNGYHPPEEPTTQSLAARLAPSLSQNGQPKQFDRESFGQLLRTCLESTEEDQPNTDEDIEANHELICVVVKAAFGNGQLDGPFAADDLDEEHIVDSLKVIELTIRKVPTVLHKTSATEELGLGNADVPLFLWLFPKLFSLLNHGQWPLLDESVLQVVTTSIDVETRRAHAPRFSGPSLGFLQGYAAGGSTTVLTRY